MRGFRIIAVVFAALVAATAAHGHASLIQSEPTDRTVVAQSPAILTLTFNEPVSPLALRLAQPTGELVELKNVVASGTTVTVAMPAGLPRGTHLVSWRVISADGHPVGGSLTFSVGEPSAARAFGSPEGDIRLRPAIWIARFVLYVGLFVGVGGAFYSRWIAALPVPERIARTNTVAMQCGVIAALVSVGFQGADALGEPLASIREWHVWRGGLSTTYALTLGIAVTAFVLGLASTVAKEPVARWCAALALAAVGVALAASGHAATAGPAWVTRSAVFLHVATVTFWVGALWPLAMAVCGSQSRDELLRFSKIIPLPLLVLVTSGIVLAIIQVRRLDALWTTSYGLILCAKLVAVCAVLACAALNRRLTPLAASGEPRSAQLLVRSIRIELLLVAVVVGLVASWRFTPPPRSLLAAEAQPIRVHIHTAKAMADLQIGPQGVDGRRITLALLDGEFRPLPAKEVVLVLSKPEVGIEALRLPASRQEDATWRIDGVRLPTAGRWQGRIEILVSDFEKVAIEEEIELR